MATTNIKLGSGNRLVELFSYPNKPDSTESLADTILHWANQMLARDGIAHEVASATVRIEDGTWFLDVEGPAEATGYVERFPEFLRIGGAALDDVIGGDPPCPGEGLNVPPEEPWPDWVDPPLSNTMWDPQSTGKWRFFLPFGMAMLNQKALNFFHYPPMRLLDEMRDYLDDPVPVRLIELMTANGITTAEEAWLYSTVMDGAPIAAPDDQGTIYKSPTDWKNAVHLLPIQEFHTYQKELTALLLNTSQQDSKFTVPVVVWGASAKKSFNAIYGTKLGKTARTENCRPGLKTNVLASGHPYAYFAQVQSEVGAGEMLPEKWTTAVRVMKHDLAVIRWMKESAESPARDPADLWSQCQAYWEEADQQETLYALCLHQGSLWYPDPLSLQFKWKLSLDQAQERAKAL